MTTPTPEHRAGDRDGHHREVVSRGQIALRTVAATETLGKHRLTAAGGCTCGTWTVLPNVPLLPTFEAHQAEAVVAVLFPAGSIVAGIDWSRLGWGTCPGCGQDKFLGHGPLCTDCLLARAGGGTQNTDTTEEPR